MAWFPGVSTAYLSVGDITPFEPAGAWTMYMRVRPMSLSPAGNGVCLGTRWQGSGDRAWLLNADASGTQFNILGADNNGYGENAGAKMKVGVWNYVFAIFTGSSGALYLYMSGVMSPGTAVGATTIKNSTLGAFFGARQDSGVTDQNLLGWMEDLTTWDAALSVAQMNTIMRGERPDKVARGAISGYWPLKNNYQNLLDLSAAVAIPASGGAKLAESYEVNTHGTMPWVAEEIPVGEVDPPFLTVGATGLVPTVVGPTPLTAPFLTVGATAFAPSVGGQIYPPFLTVGTLLSPPIVLEGSLPPFPPPPGPPGGGPPSGGGGGSGGSGGGPGGGGLPVLPPLSSGGLAGIRFYTGPPWRWVVTTLETQTLTFLDRLTFQAEVKYILDGTATAKLTVPSDNPEVNILDDDGYPFVDEGDRLLYGFRREGGFNDSDLKWVCRYAGTILQTEDTGLTENARTVISAEDPWQLLYQRPMVNIDGDFPDTAGFFSFDDTQVGHIALTFLRNTIINHGSVGIDMGDTTPAWSVDTDGNPVQLPGTAFWGNPLPARFGALTKSKYETTTQLDLDLQQGISVGEVFDQMIQTGALDILLTPIYDPINRPGYTHEISIVQRAGREATDSVFGWDKPGRNLVRISHMKDGHQRANTVRYYQGQGGQPVSGGIPISYGPSILRYGEYWAQQFFPGRIEDAALAIAQLQLFLRENGVDTVEIEPTVERAPWLFLEWFLGDTVSIPASRNLRQALSGFQRIYGTVVNVDENSYETLPQVLGSPED